MSSRKASTSRMTMIREAQEHNSAAGNYSIVYNELGRCQARNARGVGVAFFRWIRAVQGRRSAGTGQLLDPRSCGHKGQEGASRMFLSHRRRDERIGVGGGEEAHGSSTKALVPKNTGQTRQELAALACLLPRPRGGKHRHRHRQTGSRRDHRKSRAMSF